MKLISNKTEKLTRRRVLGVMGLTAASTTTLSFLTFTTGLPKLVKAGSVQNSKNKFSIITSTEDGVFVNSIAEPKRLSFTITGNIQTAKSIPLVAIPKGDNLTSEMSKQKNAALELLAVSGAFVAPRDFEIQNKRHIGKVTLPFMTLGEESSSRLIRININLLDGSGNTVQNFTRSCADQRFAVKQVEGFVRSGIPLNTSMANHVFFKYDSRINEGVKSIEITFEDI